MKVPAAPGTAIGSQKRRLSPGSVIAKQGGWAPHSKVLAGYLEVVDQWEDNALLGVL